MCVLLSTQMDNNNHAHWLINCYYCVIRSDPPVGKVHDEVTRLPPALSAVTTILYTGQEEGSGVADIISPLHTIRGNFLRRENLRHD
jgi:hypothetical protein